MKDKKKCSVCGQPMHMKFHGACQRCLSNVSFLPPGLRDLSYRVPQMTGKTKKNVRGLVRASLTLIHDKDVFCYRWNPVDILTKNIEKADGRPWLNQQVINEIREILSRI